MLVLARKLHESIRIGDEIEVSVVEIKGDQVKLGIKAPPRITVHRQEVYEAIQRENVSAAEAEPSRVPSLDGVLNQSRSEEPNQSHRKQSPDKPRKPDKPSNSDGPGKKRP